jgi:hypothetical protein
MMDSYTQKVYRNWVFAELGWDRTQIRFPAAQRTIDVDHSSKEYRVRPIVPGGSPVWDPTDSDCTKMALKFSLSDLMQVGEGVVAGIRTIRYTGVRRSKERKDIWLAPSLGCMQMLVITWSHNAFGLPTSYSREEAVFVQIGEPDELLFSAPTGYREIR